jgi:multiple sugar transport system substrate-binding protein
MHNDLRRRITRRAFVKGTAALSAATAVDLFQAPPSAALPPSAVAPGAGTTAPLSAQAKFSGKLSAWGVVSFTKEGDALLGQQMAEWGRQHNVQVEYSPLPGSDYFAKVAAAVEAGALPDVVMMLGDQTIFYATQGKLVDLTDVYGEIKTLAGGMYKSLLPYVTVNGKFYAIPMEADVTVMYARLDLCEKVTGRREPPATLDALEEIARKVQSPPTLYGIGLPIGRTPDTTGNLTLMIYADGGTLVDGHGRPHLENAGVISALTRAKRWWTDKLIQPDSPSADDAWNNNAYQSHRAVFVFNPASIFAWLEKNDQDLLKMTAQAPFPKGKAGVSAQQAGTWSWAVSATSKNVAAAKALIKDIMQPKGLEAVYEKVGGRWYPVYKDLSRADFWKKRPFFDLFPGIIEHARPEWYPASAAPQLLTQLSAARQKFILADMVQDVCLNGRSPEAAAKAAQVKMEQAFQEALRK